MFGTTTSTPVKTPAKKAAKKAVKKATPKAGSLEEVEAAAPAAPASKKRAARKQTSVVTKTKSVAQLKLYAARAVAAAQNAEKREKLSEARSWVKQLEHDGNRLAREVSANDNALIRARAVLEKLEPKQ
jgi:tRNA threonylcarbamoyladenosine modification (KEOPS) complex  Pcc1 subunit